MPFEVNDIVQIVDESHHWFPALIVVSEPKSFGLQGYLHVVSNGEEPNGQAYIRLNTEQVVKVGRAEVVLHPHED